MTRTRIGGWLAGVLVLGAVMPPTTVHAQDADEQAVLAVVQQLFDGMRQKDEALLRAVFHPEARLHTAGAESDGGPRVTSTVIESFITGVVGSDRYLDEVTFDEEVRIDGNLATAWTPYNLFVDDAFSHCGVDAFVMVRTVDGWQILQLVDTRSRTGCDPERRGR